MLLDASQAVTHRRVDVHALDVVGRVVGQHHFVTDAVNGCEDVVVGSHGLDSVSVKTTLHEGAFLARRPREAAEQGFNEPEVDINRAGLYTVHIPRQFALCFVGWPGPREGCVVAQRPVLLRFKAGCVVGEHPRVAQSFERGRRWNRVATELGDCAVNSGDVRSLKIGVSFTVDGNDGVRGTNAGLEGYGVQPSDRLKGKGGGERVQGEFFPDVFVDAAGGFWEHRRARNACNFVHVPSADIGVGQVARARPVQFNLPSFQLGPFNASRRHVSGWEDANEENDAVLGHRDVHFGEIRAKRVGIHAVKELPSHAVCIGEVAQVNGAQIDVFGQDRREVKGQVQTSKAGVVR
ncbi:MAG: hypothetical protein ACPICH_06235 [Poseidonia sp.]